MKADDINHYHQLVVVLCETIRLDRKILYLLQLS
jgi:hypothetical protein